MKTLRYVCIYAGDKADATNVSSELDKLLHARLREKACQKEKLHRRLEPVCSAFKDEVFFADDRYIFIVTLGIVHYLSGMINKYSNWTESYSFCWRPWQAGKYIYLMGQYLCLPLCASFWWKCPQLVVKHFLWIWSQYPTQSENAQIGVVVRDLDVAFKFFKQVF